jgi:hypothetical protein
MPRLLVMLNDLEDDWCCCCGGRVGDSAGGLNFLCTYRHRLFEGFEIHINYPLRGIESPDSLLLSDGPKVFITTAWVNATSPDARRVSGGNAVPEEDPVGKHAEEPGEPEEPEQQDDPDDGGTTAEGLSDLCTQVSRRELLADDPGYPMDKVWESRTKPITRYVDDRDRRIKKPRIRERVEFEGRLSHRESSSLIWRNELLLLHDWREFSWPLRYFVQKFPLHLLGWRVPVIETMRASLEVIRTVPAPKIGRAHV